MEQRGYIADGDKVADLISGNIYNPIHAIIEEAANFYDADATEVNIDFIEEEVDGNIYITEIRICGDGEGFSTESLTNINILVNSSKREEIYTKKFKRVKLGSFGIAFVALGTLGSEIEIYSKSKKNIYLYRKINIDCGIATFSDIIILNECDKIKYESGCTIIIKNCRILKEIFLKENILQHKLSFLPIENNFEVYLCNNKVHRFKIDYENSYKCEFQFNIDNMPFHAKIFYSRDTIEKDNAYYRGVFLMVNKRIIDWNIFDEIADKITTPGSTSTRIHGYIEVEDILFTNKLKASRDGIRDYILSFEIKSILKKNISGINKKAKQYYEWDKKNKLSNDNNKDVNLYKNELERNLKCNQESERKNQELTVTIPNNNFKNNYIEKAKKRTRSPNKDLQKLDMNFCYTPTEEVEVIIITSELCQKKLLDFNLLKCSYKNKIDSVIFRENKPAVLEFEFMLNNFFTQNHSCYDTDYILCWDVDKENFDKNLSKYANKNGYYIERITNNFDYTELCFYMNDNSVYKIKVYILVDIINQLVKRLG